MKIGLLEYSTPNLGDEIQSIAARRFLPRVDTYLDRDWLAHVRSREQIKLIMNGWFTHRPEHWPPSSAIEPLFVSVHISPAVVDEFTSENSIRYLKSHEPIGCRDYHTRDVLTDHGVDAYFSGCLTLTLSKERYQTGDDQQGRADDILLVDVDEEVTQALPAEIRSGAKTLTHHYKSPVNRVCDGLLKKLDLKRYLYRTRVDRPYNAIRNAAHRLVYSEGPIDARNVRFLKATQRLQRYATADLVVTSRLHVTLPCVAFETPVVLVHGEDARFSGLKQFFQHYTVEEVKRKALEVDWDGFTNPEAPADIEAKLSSRVKEFIL